MHPHRYWRRNSLALSVSLCTLVSAVRSKGVDAQLATSRPPIRADSALTLRQVVEYALDHSPDLNIAKRQIDSARAEQRVARALQNPTASIAPGTPFQYSVTQPIDVGPARTYRMRAAGRGTVAAALDAENTKRHVVFAVRQGFLDLLLAETSRRVAFEQDTIMRRLLRNDSLRFTEGDLALRDLSTTELERARTQSALARAEAAARAARISLQLLMGMPRPDTAFRVEGTLEYRAIDLPVAIASDSSRAASVAARADVAAARERVDQSDLLRSLATAQLWPVPGIAAVYQPEAFSSGSRYAIGASFSLPVMYWFGGERARATAGLASARIEQQRTVATAEAELASAVDNFRTSQVLAARYADGLLDKARNAVEMQRFAYEHGNASLLDLLNAVSAFGEVNADYYTAVHDYLVAAYAIDLAIGRDVVP